MSLSTIGAEIERFDKVQSLRVNIQKNFGALYMFQFYFDIYYAYMYIWTLIILVLKDRVGESFNSCYPLSLYLFYDLIVSLSISLSLSVCV